MDDDATDAVDGLSEAARAVGYPLDRASCDALVAWAELVIEWRKAAQLTSLRSTGDVLRELMEPALCALRVVEIARDSHTVDFGCGNVCTGITLALATAGGKWTLLDRDEKKLTFCRYALARCRIESLGARVRLAGEVDPGSADVLLLRGTPRSAELAEAADRLLAPQGVVVRWVPKPPRGNGPRAVRCGWRNLWVVASQPNVSRETLHGRD